MYDSERFPSQESEVEPFSQEVYVTFINAIKADKTMTDQLISEYETKRGEGCLKVFELRAYVGIEGKDGYYPRYFDFDVDMDELLLQFKLYNYLIIDEHVFLRYQDYQKKRKYLLRGTISSDQKPIIFSKNDREEESAITIHIDSPQEENQEWVNFWYDKVKIGVDDLTSLFQSADFVDSIGDEIRPENRVLIPKALRFCQNYVLDKHFLAVLTAENSNYYSIFLNTLDQANDHLQNKLGLKPRNKSQERGAFFFVGLASFAMIYQLYGDFECSKCNKEFEILFKSYNSLIERPNKRRWIQFREKLISSTKILLDSYFKK